MAENWARAWKRSAKKWRMKAIDNRRVLGGAAKFWRARALAAEAREKALREALWSIATARMACPAGQWPVDHYRETALRCIDIASAALAASGQEGSDEG